MEKSQKIIAIIPARSGSKGLPDKNIKDLNGKPLVAYSIEAAVESKCFDKIIVSTDSEKYAQISRKFGAEVPFLRSEKTSNDAADNWIVCEEVLNNLGEKYDVVVILQPTSPLRTAQNIQEALNLFFEKNADFVVSVAKLPHPLEWCSSLPENNSLENFVKVEHRNKRRQELPQSYTLNGALYIAKADLIKSGMELYSKNSYAYIMDESNSIDIDNESDFIKAQFLKSSELNLQKCLP